MFRFLFLVIFNLMSFIGLAQCPNSLIELLSQQDVDDFASNYPGCTELINGFRVDGADITNLNGLIQLESSTISSFITISSTSIVNFTGLDNLHTVGRKIEILSNTNLSNFVGLEQLETINSDLFVAGNTSLTSFQGLSGLISVGGALRIQNNPMLVDFGGMNNLSVLGIEGTQPLGNRGMIVEQNNSITSFDGLNNLTEIDGVIDITGNPSLESFNGLHNISWVGFAVLIDNNDNLLDLSGFDSLEVIAASNLEVKYNDQMENFEGLNGLRTIGSNLMIFENSNLNSIDALAGVDPNPFNSTLIISDNPNLPFCSIEVVCANIGDTTLFIQVEGNASGCNSVQEIEDNCILGLNEDEIFSFTIFPNPAQNVLNIQLNEPIDFIRIYTTAGKLVKESKITQIDLTNLQTGLYLAKVSVNGKTLCKKFMKS